MRTFKSSIVFVIAVAIAPSLGVAQDPQMRPRPPSVTANAEAVIMVEPDEAELDIGVVTQARNALDAASENAENLARVLASVKKLLATGDEIKTASYSLNPNYRYPREGGKPEITGYTATNVLRIKTGSLDRVGKIIDTAMQAGANTISRLAFTLKDEHNAQLKALRLASSKAKTKAEEMANALGLKITRILSVAEGDRSVRPILPQARGGQMEALATVPTPIETGSIEVRSSVTLTAEVGPK